MNNFILICKSDFLGNVNLPKLKFIIIEENNNPIQNVYDALLYFNCISKEEWEKYIFKKYLVNMIS